MSGITADFSGAIAKTETLLEIPRAARYQLESFASGTITALRNSAIQKHYAGRGRGKTTGHLKLNIGREVTLSADAYKVTIGTGVGGKKLVKYAEIQDEGGVTHPMVTAKMRKWAWAMYYKSFKTEIKGMGLKDAARRGALETFKVVGGGGKYKAIALTKKPKLDVRIPASHWFTEVKDRREPILKTMMDECKIAYVAKQLSGGADAV